MGNWYVYPGATGANNGTSQADAWTDLQSAFDAELAGTISYGDTIYCRGTQTLTTAILLKAFGSATSYFNYIAVDDTWAVNNDAYFTLDADGVAANAIDFQTLGRFHYYKNFKFINATGDGAKANGSNALLGCRLINCHFDNNGGDGIALGSGGNYSTFIFCKANNNVVDGFSAPQFCHMTGCEAIGNGRYGYLVNSIASLVHCIAHDNVQDGFWVAGYGAQFYACVSDGNGGDGFQNSSNGGVFFGCRSTNNTGYGFRSETSTIPMLYCAHYNNTAGATTGSFIEIETTATAGDDYEDRANDNFNLTDNAEARDFVVDIDGTNEFGLSAGLQPVAETGEATGTLSIDTDAPVLGMPESWFSETTAALDPEEALRDIALDDVAVSNVIGTRFYPSQADYKPTYPLALYSRVGDKDYEKINGVSDDKLAVANIQLDIFGKGYASAKDLAKKIKSALNGYTGTVTIEGDSITIRRVRLINGNDGFEKPTRGRTNGIHHAMQEYEVWYLNV